MEKHMKVFLGVMAVAVIAAGGYYYQGGRFNFSPSDVEGSGIGGVKKSKRHHRENSAEIDLHGKEVQQLIKKDEFQKMMKEEKFRVLMKSSSFSGLAKNDQFPALVRNSAFTDMAKKTRF